MDLWSNTISQLFDISVDDSEARCFWGFRPEYQLIEMQRYRMLLADLFHLVCETRAKKYGPGVSRYTVLGLERVPDSEDRNWGEWEGAGSNLKADFLTR